MRRLNGDRSSLEDHLRYQPILAWSAAESNVLVGAPDLRRRLIDRVSVGLKPASLSVLSHYRRALDHKRALLTQQSRSQLETLHSFNTLLAESSERLIRQRHSAVQQLRSSLDAVCRTFPRPGFSLDLLYRSSPGHPFISGAEAGSESPASKVSGQSSVVLEKVWDDVAPIGWARASFEAAVEKEVRFARPILGPHRDRIDVLFRGRPVAETASAGERKAIGLLLLAAQARLLSGAQRAPVLLVDDVDTEMDQATLEAIWPLLTQVPQCFFSSNREAVFSNLCLSASWAVRSGSVKTR